MLNAYGYQRYLNHVTLEPQPELTPARVISVHRGRFGIVTQMGEGWARPGGSFMHDTARGDFPTAGDYVLVRFNPAGDSLIINCLPRFAKFVRPDYSGHAAGYVKTILEQVVAANFDAVMIMSSLNKDFNLNRIQRYLAAARQGGGQPVILLNKLDLCSEPAPYIEKAQAVAGDAPVIPVSAATGEGTEKLAPYLIPGSTLIFLGSSGVGKSSLVNYLAGGEVMDVNGIREEDARGRHTTTHRQIIHLASGALVIDTPGMRELGMWEVDQGLTETFSDIQALVARCRFSNCSHQKEPGCAVQAAIAADGLSPARWAAYCSLLKENNFTRVKAVAPRGKKPRAY